MRADLTGPVSEEFVECSDSVSCLHALERFGLGSYGDPIKYCGHIVGIE